MILDLYWQEAGHQNDAALWPRGGWYHVSCGVLQQFLESATELGLIEMEFFIKLQTRNSIISSEECDEVVDRWRVLDDTDILLPTKMPHDMWASFMNYVDMASKRKGIDVW